MKNKKISPLIPIISVLFSCTIFVALIINHMKDIKSYKQISKEDELFLEVKQFKDYKGALLFKLDNGRRISIWAYNYNEDYNDDNDLISYVIASGDTIYKHPNSDTIYVKNGDKKYYYFVH